MYAKDKHKNLFILLCGFILFIFFFEGRVCWGTIIVLCLSTDLCNFFTIIHLPHEEFVFLQISDTCGRQTEFHMVLSLPSEKDAFYLLG